MATWIENEAGDKLVNADQVQTFLICPRPVAANEGADFGIIATGHDWDLTLLDGLTRAQAMEAMKHLTLWLPAQTPRTIRMGELAKSIRRAGLVLVGEEGDRA